MSQTFGIVGQSGSGKDTIADFLTDEYGFVKISFADPMKRFCMELFDFTEAQLWGPSEMRNGPDTRYQRGFYYPATREVPKSTSVQLSDPKPVYLTPRYALQTLGTEWGRDCYPDIWVEYAMRQAKELLDETEYVRRKGYLPSKGIFYATEEDDFLPRIHGVVIADVRFKNEMEIIKREGGKVIKVVRPGYTGAVGIANHPSEEEQKSIPDEAFDYVLYNDEPGLSALHKKVRAMVAILKAR